MASGFESIQYLFGISLIGTEQNWRERRRYLLQEVFDSMTELINLAYSQETKSLATLKPVEIVGFEIEEDKTDWD
jgi:hypothetical protein